MNEVGKFLVVAGLLMAFAGALLWSGVGCGWLGRLPGDIHYSRGNFHFYFPLVTCLILSVLLTLILWLFRR
jgi:membrane protein implicated in regulation of membrane protease activity